MYSNLLLNPLNTLFVCIFSKIEAIKIQINKGSTDTQTDTPSLFIMNHIAITKKYNGNRRFKPYLERLKPLHIYLELKPTSSDLKV